MLKELKALENRTTFHYAPTLRTFYRPEMALPEQAGYSQSPQKPRLLMERGAELGLSRLLQMDSDWAPFTKREFKLAHTANYVEGFFAGESPHAESNNLRWSAALAESVRYTNASLYHAIAAAIENPQQVCFSPTSGFHHATPQRGQGFCTFSGQVIASLKLWRKQKLVGAYIDLDGHFGNSIEDSRAFCPDLDAAVPREFNINPKGEGENYRSDLAESIARLLDALAQKKVHYVVLCHGADSHEADDLGGSLRTVEWIGAANLVYVAMNLASDVIGPVSLTLSLFGGYRQDNYTAVLDLHWMSLSFALDTLAGKKTYFQPDINAPQHTRYAV